jgi:hypothetical protein
MANTMLCRKFIVFPTAQLHCLKFRKSSALDDLMLPAWCFFFLVATDLPGIPACFLCGQTAGYVALQIPKATFGCARGEVSLAFSVPSPAEVSTPRSGRNSPSRSRDGAISQPPISAWSPQATPQPKSPASLRGSANHKRLILRALPPLTSRGCSLAGPRWGPCYHQTLCHLVSRCGSRASSYAHHLDVVPANLKMNLLP